MVADGKQKASAVQSHVLESSQSDLVYGPLMPVLACNY
jgi:hypothetical protein